jgi:sialidase-1
MLTTGLSDGSRSAKSLTSGAFVTDDQWHRVVLTWDGTNRTLQMDGVEVARDTQPSLAASSGNLHIGAGKDLGTTAFWSGLIDDVRVYNRAVQP